MNHPAIETYQFESNQNKRLCFWRLYRNGKKSNMAFLIPEEGTKPDELPQSIWDQAQINYKLWKMFC